MKKLSPVTECIQPSLTRKLFNMAKQYDDVIDFTLGDPDIPTPHGIKQAGCDAIMSGKTRYSQNAGLLELRKAISSYYENKESLAYDPVTEILVSVGAMEGLYLALLAIICPEDEVIIPAPYYVNYEQMVMMCGGKPVIVEGRVGDGLSCSIDNIRSSITPNTKAIIVNTPCNPTGKVIGENKLHEIACLAKENDLYVITDEVYKCLIYDNIERPKSIASFPDMKKRTIYINSLSKEFCMTGWRLGYVMADSQIIAAMTKLQENIAACAPLPSQYAAIEALRLDKDYSKEMASIFQRRRDVLVDEFGRIDKSLCESPQATFYAMVDIIRTGMNSEEFAYGLLESQHVAVVPGKTYGRQCDHYVRIAFTIDEDKIREGIRRIGKYLYALLNK